MTVNQVELVFPHDIRQLGQMFHHSRLYILCGHLIRHFPQKFISHVKQILFPQKLTDHSAASIIIHRRIPLMPLQIPGTISPVLCQNIGLWIFLPNALLNLRPQFVSQLKFIVSGKDICHIKSPAINGIGRFQPLLQYRILSPVNHLPQSVRSVIEHRQIRHVKPAQIFVCARFKEIIASLLGIGIVVGTFRLVKIQSISVKPAVGSARMVNGNIQNQFHAICMQFC